MTVNKESYTVGYHGTHINMQSMYKFYVHGVHKLSVKVPR